MESEALANRIAQLAIEALATDIVILDLRALSDVVDFFVIVSGKSNVHLDAIAVGIDRGTRATSGVSAYHREGETGSHWILLDYIDVVVHIFMPATRQFYALEDLWGDAPILRVEAPRLTPEGYDEYGPGEDNGDI